VIFLTQRRGGPEEGAEREGVAGGGIAAKEMVADSFVHGGHFDVCGGRDDLGEYIEVFAIGATV